jgi:glycine/D-amino acid oxidase-like deaminating enzyme
VKVTVVGAGLVGSNIAYRLATAGAEVTVVESGVPGAVASATSYAWLNSNNVSDTNYHMLRCLGMAAYPELARDLGHGDWLHTDGNLHIAYGDAAGATLRDRVERLRGLGYPARLIDTDEVAAREPALRLTGPVAAAAFYPGEGWIDATPLIGDLLAGFQRAGGTLVSGRVARLSTADGRVAGVELADGTVIGADTVVLCAGATSELLAGTGVDVSLIGEVGASVVTAPAPVRVKALIHLPDLSIRPDGNARLVIRAKDIDEAVDTDTMTLPQDAVDEVVRRTVAALDIPGGTLTAAEVRTAFRPRPPDGRPIIGAVDGVPGAYLVSTHSGATLGALLGNVVTQEVVYGREEPLLAPFRLSRVITPAVDDVETESVPG